MSVYTPLVLIDANDDHANSRTVPFDQVSGLSVLDTVTNGSWALVDRGGGQWAWRLAAGAGVVVTAESSNAAYTKAIVPGVASGDPGIVMAVRGAYTTVNPNSTSRPRVGWLNSSDAGLRFARDGWNTTGFHMDWNFVQTAATAVVGTGLITHSARFDINRALDGYDVLSKWVQGTSGNSPDSTSSVPANWTGLTLSKLQVQASDTDVYELTNWVIWREAGITATFTDAVMRSLANDLAGTLTPAAPVLSVGVGAATGNTTASIGCSVDKSSGTLWRYMSANATELAATIKASGTTSTVTGIGVQGPFTASSLTDGATYYAHFVFNDGTTDSNVLSVGPIYPGTWRPGADITVTGWTVTGAATHAAALAENASVADATKDASYTTSPPLSLTPALRVLELDDPMPAGHYNLRVRIEPSAGSAFYRLTLMDNSNATLGVSADTPVSGAYAEYEIPITISGTATRTKEEIWI